MPLNPKIWQPGQMNAWQFLALVGVPMTAAAHLLLWAAARSLPNFWLLYLTWAAVFVLGTLRNIYGRPDDDHHHHH